MNCLDAVVEWGARAPQKLALWSQARGSVGYRDFLAASGAVQSRLLARGFARGDTLLLAAPASPGMFAAMSAVIGLGGCVLIVEPWLDLASLEHVFATTKPRFLVASAAGWLWSRRVPSLRRLEHCLTLREALRGPPGAFQARDVAPGTPATVTFTSGTLGQPKGITRSHAFIDTLVEILSEGGARDAYSAPDLAVFPGLSMLHLCTGRGSMLVGNRWHAGALRRLGAAAEAFQPATLSAGPAFFARLLAVPGFGSLRHLYIGGASPECALVERLAERWPEAQITHIYGGSEAEPIAMGDARAAAAASRACGYSQVLHLGRPLPFIRLEPSPAGLWVAGPNVCGEYIGAHPGNASHKRRDASGVLWHLTGDRVTLPADGAAGDGGLLYGGRATQDEALFWAEQRVYAALGHTRAMLHRVGDHVILVGEGLRKRRAELRVAVPELAGMLEAKVARDRRHRARLDRAATLRPRSALRRWSRFLNERAPLPMLALIAAGPTVGAARAAGAPLLSLRSALTCTGLILALVTARLMDERKDLHKDTAVNPTRPLPRGLLTASEVGEAVWVALGLLAAIAAAFAALGSALASAATLAVAAYLLLMEREFLVGPSLARRPLLYAVTHQLLIVPLYLLPFLAAGEAKPLNAALTAGFLLANFAGSMCYEIARKLDPAAPAGRETYLQIYGGRRTALLLGLFGALGAAGSLCMGTMGRCWPLLALFAVTLYRWRRRPASYRGVEASTALFSLSQLWALVLFP